MTRASEDTNRRLLRARDAMDRDYAMSLNVDDLARVALMASSHFAREFKRVFGETPYRYLQRRRVERAMFLLQHDSATVTEVCEAVGFSSLGTFSRTFAAIVGLTPTAYRQQSRMQRRIAPTSFAMRWTRPAAETSPGRARAGFNGGGVADAVEVLDVVGCAAASAKGRCDRHRT